MSERLLDLLEARSGIVCAVGAGGKKSVLYRLVAAHPGRVALTATTFTTHFPDSLGTATVIDNERRLLERVAAQRSPGRVSYACPSDKPDRHAGVSPGLIERVHEECGFEATFVKADGARMRWIKAPVAGEPVLPEACRTVIALVSARALGEPLTARVAHRVEQIGSVTGAREHERLTPAHVARLIASPEGLLKGSEGRRVIPVINMVDDREREVLARETAQHALELSDRLYRIVLTSLRDPHDPVVAVIER
ncbi:MAG TPA: selenium cofactor biosynthesis protein YqeC [Gammaproteobacteria bacterium]|nr:selenium cofactor biosynthesis protein YqeC [Gammaproteobacteria bacterium]